MSEKVKKICQKYVFRLNFIEKKTLDINKIYPNRLFIQPDLSNK